ncbi:hypothetical protein [Dongia sp. agr-C8]
MRRYALTLFGLLLLLLGGALGVSWFGLDQCTLLDRNICGLYHFQAAKLAAAPERVDLLLLGDSSLGNGVDARAMAAQSGRTVLNLALSGGALGLPAIETQLRQAIRRGMKIENLVVMVSPELYRRRFSASADGFVLANARDPAQVLALPPKLAVKAAASLLSFLFDSGVQADGIRTLMTGARDTGDCTGCATLDYVAQEAGGKPTPDDIKEWRGPYDDFDPFLERIAALCRKQEINCLYMHGPTIQAVLDLNPGYVEKIDAKVGNAGLRLVSPAPVIISPGDVGDSVNHIRPDLRAALSDRIYALIAPLLR